MAKRKRPADGNRRPSKPPELPPMTKGEGHSRGGPTNPGPLGDDEVVEEEFRATGRTHPFKL